MVEGGLTSGKSNCQIARASAWCCWYIDMLIYVNIYIYMLEKMHVDTHCQWCSILHLWTYETTPVTWNHDMKRYNAEFPEGMGPIGSLHRWKLMKPREPILNLCMWSMFNLFESVSCLYRGHPGSLATTLSDATLIEWDVDVSFI
jgi:hypothetical protein